MLSTPWNYLFCVSNGKLKFDKVIWTSPDLMQSNWFRAISTADFAVRWEFDIVWESPCDSFHFELQTNCPFWVFSLSLWLLFKCLLGKFFLNLVLTVPSLLLLPLSFLPVFFFFFFLIHHLWETTSYGDLLNFTLLHASLFLGCVLKFLPYILAVISHIFTLFF